MKPQLAYNGEWNWSDITFKPFYVSEKLDGVRCLTTPNGAWTKNGKLIPNKWISEELSKLPVGLDGELITYTDGKQDDFHTCSGKIRQIHLKHVAFMYYVFDRWNMPGCTYEQRLQSLSVFDKLVGVSVLPQYMCSTREEVEKQVEYWRSLKLDNFEGVMIRNPRSLYKAGRCTLREQNIFKLVEWLRDEALIVDFEPCLNHPDRVGAIKCNWHGKTIRVGSGFNHFLSRDMRANPRDYLGRTITFKYKKVDDLPRQPIFVGFYS